MKCELLHRATGQLKTQPKPGNNKELQHPKTTITLDEVYCVKIKDPFQNKALCTDVKVNVM